MDKLLTGSEAAPGMPDSLLDRAFDSLPVAILLVAKDGHVERGNLLAEQVFGYGHGQMTGLAVSLVVAERALPQVQALIEETLDTAHALPLGAVPEVTGRRSDGAEFPIGIGLNPVQTERGPMVLSAVVDMSERNEREARISAALKEKDLLLGEIHHRVKNNLQIVHSLLDLQALDSSDPVFGELMRDVQARVRAMALVHQTLYQSKDFASVNFQAFLETMLAALADSWGRAAGPVEWAINARDVHLPINIAIPCGLIVSELVTNALKHAFPLGRGGVVGVALSEDFPGEITLSVMNDGKPIPKEFDFEGGGTLGLRLVRLLVEQMHGSIRVESDPSPGFVMTFRAEASA